MPRDVPRIFPAAVSLNATGVREAEAEAVAEASGTRTVEGDARGDGAGDIVGAYM